MSQFKQFYWIGFLLVFLGFGLNHLGKFLSRDESLWLYDRVPQYYHGWSQWELERTLINDKPGVLPSILAGLVGLFDDQSNYDYSTFDQYLYLWRLPILLFNGLMMVLIFVLVRRLLDFRTAVLALGGLCLTPQLIAYSQMVNPDSTVWTTSFVSFLYFLHFLKKRRAISAWLAGLFMGLALISKFTANLLFPMYFIMLYLDYLFGNSSGKELLRGFRYLMAIFLTAVAVYALAVPACLMDLSLLVDRTIGARGLRQIKYPLLLFMVLTLGEVYLFKGVLSAVLRKVNWLGFLTRIVGLYFLALCCGLLFNVILGSPWFDFHSYFVGIKIGQGDFLPTLVASHFTTLNMLTFPLLGGFLFLLVFMTLGSLKNNDRTGIILYSMILIMALFLGAASSGYYLNVRYHIFALPFFLFAVAVLLSSWKRPYTIVLILFCGLNLYACYRVSPFYYNFQNYTGLYQKPIWSTYGYGGYEIAQFLNQLPDAGSISVGVDLGGRFIENESDDQRPMVWRERAGFHPFFKGKISPYIRSLQYPLPDYLILTPRGDRFFEEMTAPPDGEFDKDFLQGLDLQSLTLLFEKYRTRQPLFRYGLVDYPPLELRVVKVDKEDFISFKGSAAFNTGLSVDLSKSFSVSFWVLANNATPGLPLSLTDSTGQGIKVASAAWNRFGNYRLDYHFADSIRNCYTGYIHDGSWHHLVLRQDVQGDSAHFAWYVDGSFRCENSGPATLGSLVSPLIHPIDGAADNFRFYDFALSEEQILKLFQYEAHPDEKSPATDSEIPSPIGRYRMFRETYRSVTGDPS